MKSARLLACAASVACVAAGGLIDAPMLGAAPAMYLDGNAWTVSTMDGSGYVAGASVPGDLITDLQNAELVGDPLFELNMLQSMWDIHPWRYTRSFDLDASTIAALQSASEVLLVVDGVKMASNVTLNNVPLFSTTNQFVRYTATVKSILAKTGNVLTIDFPITNQDHRNDMSGGRFMGCSGGWDWAPYSNSTSARTPMGINTMSKGIYKSVYLLPVQGAAMTTVTALPVYDGGYPTAPLTASWGDFHVDVSVRLWAPSQATGSLLQGTLSVGGNWGAGGAACTKAVTLTAGAETTVNCTLTAKGGDVQLWWPNGMGSQPLYAVNATFTPATPGLTTLSTTRTVGFKVLYLVTADDTQPAIIDGVNGSGNLTMRFKINGADVFMRGANWIPMEEMEGRQTADAMRAAVQYAAEAKMNVLRVWGGGVWPYDALLDAADSMGILLAIDAMFSDQDTSWHMAAPDANTESELRYQLRRIASHPSIAAWMGCNECGGSGVFESFVSTIMAQEDPSRPVWPSSPSAGWASGVNRLTGLPNGQPLHTFNAAATNPSLAPYTGSCGSAGSNATYVPAARLHGFPVSDFFVPIPVANAAACCELCATTAGCVAGMFQGGGCELVGFVYSPAVYGSGTLTVYPSTPMDQVPVVPPPNINEQHGPYRGGGGMPAVNGGSALYPFPAGIPAQLAPTQSTYGRSVQGIYTSEFGSTHMSSFESMAPTLLPSHWGILGGMAPDNCSAGFAHACTGNNPMAQRNYIASDHIVSYFGLSRPTVGLNDAGSSAFQAQLYLALLASELQVKSYIEQHRSENLYGLQTWQLNEIWPTGGWGSIEYGTVGYTPGQVLGGRWKPTHYLFGRTLYTDVFTACGTDGRCFVKNDNALAALTGTASLQLFSLPQGKGVATFTVDLQLPIGANAFQWFCMDGSAPSGACPSIASVLAAHGCHAAGTDCVLIATVTDSSNKQTATSNFMPLVAPMNLTLPSTLVSFTVGTPVETTIPITITSTAPALWVTLTTMAQGRFSDNSFFLAGPTAGQASVVIDFIPAPGYNVQDELPVLQSTLRVEHLAMYMQ